MYVYACVYVLAYVCWGQKSVLGIPWLFPTLYAEAGSPTWTQSSLFTHAFLGRLAKDIVTRLASWLVPGTSLHFLSAVFSFVTSAFFGDSTG